MTRAAEIDHCANERRGMNCPHCNHKKPFGNFLVTVANPFKIKCTECEGYFSCGALGKGLLVLLVAIGVVAGLMWDQLAEALPPIFGSGTFTMFAIALAIGFVAELAVWAFDKPAPK